MPTAPREILLFGLGVVALLACLSRDSFGFSGGGPGREAGPFVSPGAEAGIARPPTGQPSPPAGVTQAVLFVVKARANPAVVAGRIAGPAVFFQRAPAGGAYPPPGVADRLLRTYLVPVSPGTEQQVLARAQSDPEVEAAQLVRWPPFYPK